MNVIHQPLLTEPRPDDLPGMSVPAPRMVESVAPVPDEAPPPPARRARRWPWLLLGAAALAAGGYWYWQYHHAAPHAATTTTAPSEPLAPGEFRLSDLEVRSLRIEPVALRDFRAERVAEGRIAYNDDRSTPVFSPYTGRIVRTGARLGDQVTAGATLFELETTDLAGSANDLLSAADNANKARTTLEQARREERRQNDLFAARATSQRDVEQARTAAANAVADLRTAEATLAAARDKLRVLGRTPQQVTQIEQLRRVDAVVPVTAPIGGTVTQRRVGPGQWLSSGASDPVFTIADLSTMWLVAAVREVDAPLIRTGQQVQVTVGALPGRVFDARITAVGAGLDATTRRLTVRAEVQDPDRLLKPEMFATFRIAVAEGGQGVAVPLNAVIYRGSEASVWMALDGNRFVLRRIQTGLRTADALEVTDGLHAGDRVVTGGALFIDRAARID